MCKWSLMQQQQREAKERDRELIAAASRGFITRAPVGMRNVTPANMKKLVRGIAVEESAS